MCGIVGAVAERDVVPILLEGLKRLEYRGYDSAGLAVLLEGEQKIARIRRPGKIAALAERLQAEPLRSQVGIAHTRWATHGAPSESNAHPHIARGEVAVVHNGIVENYRELRKKQEASGYEFTSETDTEVIGHQIHHYMRQGMDLFEAVRTAVTDLEGAYALGVISSHAPNRLIAARRGSPLAIGFGIGEHFIASDVAALIPVTQQFVFLEDGDVAELRRQSVVTIDAAGNRVERRMVASELTADAVERGEYRHYMLKEIHEQPQAIAETLEGRLYNGRVLEETLGPNAGRFLDNVKRVQILACGTSFHAGLVARHWFESLAKIPCQVEVASEFRYRNPLATPDTLVVTISQSGETADTLAALRSARALGFGPSLAVVNVPESTLVRESDLVLMTRAGPEIGVASTKAFTTQLAALLLLVVVLGRRHGLRPEVENELVAQLLALPSTCQEIVGLDDSIAQLATEFTEKHHALFLGRGLHYPVAMEGALKLKEIAYIHAEAYPAGELKHGPLALVDAEMPVICVAPNDVLLEKLKSNLEEVRARGGQLYVFADTKADMPPTPNVHVMRLPAISSAVSPIAFTIPLQLLAYHVAVVKGTDVDQPRNLAKSVTVE
ncbi:MAG: glutamine--fructose-6-phosphate transaminase (isomerizing) [Gammaproteobacteria bacterium]